MGFAFAALASPKLEGIEFGHPVVVALVRAEVRDSDFHSLVKSEFLRDDFV